MKRSVRKRDELPKELSPITPKGQVVLSRINIFSDPANPKEQYIEEFTPNKEDALKVLVFLDELNGIGWTSDLERIERDLRQALHDLIGAKT